MGKMLAARSSRIDANVSCQSASLSQSIRGSTASANQAWEALANMGRRSSCSPAATRTLRGPHLCFLRSVPGPKPGGGVLHQFGAAFKVSLRVQIAQMPT
jgi:hypothetical protein